MKNDYKTFDTIMKGIEKQAIAEVGKYLRITNNDLIIENKHIFYDFDLETIIGANCKELVKIADSLFNTEVYPYYELAENNCNLAVTSVISYLNHKHDGKYQFIFPIKVTYNKINGKKCLISSVYVKGNKLFSKNYQKEGREFPILEEEYSFIYETVKGTENN